MALALALARIAVYCSFGRGGSFRNSFLLAIVLHPYLSLNSINRLRQEDIKYFYERAYCL